MENEKGIVKLTRKQLYDEIWALSVAGVARKYNLNYGKLIATCKVENISFPSSGYWTNYAGSRTVKAVKNDTACGDGCSFVPTETKAG